MAEIQNREHNTCHVLLKDRSTFELKVELEEEENISLEPRSLNGEALLGRTVVPAKGGGFITGMDEFFFPAEESCTSTKTAVKHYDSSRKTHVRRTKEIYDRGTPVGVIPPIRSGCYAI